ncbi:agmatine deiminase family protein [Streptomyces sp. ISL-43]|uniref:agmatine deiminase family protein n=1 Tax=Streptomyces sp. ISL-43 TaxID=2819183 RepID=UPI0027E4B22B|nr:agmatine deiminase family protein [Streptomyces sp. ISL-43]
MIELPLDDSWFRDSGPIFVLGPDGQRAGVDFRFDAWGGKHFPYDTDDKIAAALLEHFGVDRIDSRMILEGGAITVDGEGTLITTEQCLLHPNRNPGVSQAQLEAAMCAAFGASEVVWFKGVLGRDITDDHVDATSRFLAEGSGLVQMPLAKDTDAWSNDARQQYQILSTAINAQGHPVAVTKLQGPDYDKIRSRSRDFVGSYANYYVCNGAVIAPQFGDSGADAAARTTLQRAFPGRVIEQLDIDNLGAGGGGIHCVTQQQPVP